MPSINDMMLSKGPSSMAGMRANLSQAGYEMKQYTAGVKNPLKGYSIPSLPNFSFGNAGNNVAKLSNIIK